MSLANYEGSINVSGKITATAVRLYEGVNQTWNYMCVGAVVLTSTAIKVIELPSGSERISVNIGPKLNYSDLKPFFHVFDGSSSVMGLSFADTNEASQFSNEVKNKVRSGGGSGGGGSGGSAAPPPPTPSRPSGFSSPQPPQPIQQSSQPIQQQQSAAKIQPAPEKKKKTGWFGSKKEDEIEIDISTPTDFKHIGHIGYNAETGFDLKNIPEDWKKLFKTAGIKKKDLENEDTRKMIFDMMEEQGLSLGPQPTKAAPPPPPASNSRGPPPPPPAGGGSRAPPPPPPGGSRAPPPPPPSSANAGAAAGGPPPPPPPSGGGPPPPPPPPPPPGDMSGPIPLSDDFPVSKPATAPRGAPAAPGRGDLLSSIQKGTTLKKAETRELAEIPAEKEANLASMLSKAMAGRRQAVKEDDDNDDDDDWD